MGGQVVRGTYVVLIVSQNPLGTGCWYLVGIMVKDGLRLTFDLDSVIMFSTVIFKTYSSYDNDIWTYNL